MHRVLKAFLEVTIKQRINNLPYYTIILQRALCDQYLAWQEGYIHFIRNPFWCSLQQQELVHGKIKMAEYNCTQYKTIFWIIIILKLEKRHLETFVLDRIPIH